MMAATTADATIPRVSMPFDEDAEGDERREDAIRSAAAAAEPPSLVDERDAAPLDASGKDPAAAKQSKRKGKKMVIALFLALFFFIILGVGSYVVIRLVAGKKSEPTLKVGGARETAAGAPNAPSSDEKLEAALNVLASRDTKAAGAGGVNPVTTDPGAVDQSGLGTSNTNPGPNGHTGAGDGAGLRSETVGGERGSGGPFFGGDAAGGGDARQGAGAQPTPAQSGSAADDARGGLAAAASSVSGSVPGTPARSVLHSPRRDAAAMPSPATAGAGEGGRAPGGTTAAGSLTLPSFGAMLPVKSLGAIYTLRSSGGVVRFEVAYEKRGKGWVIPKGTEIVGVVRGSDRDRAFITMTGMIDPQTGKFVKLAGDLLGADGATGVRGERKRLSGRWASFFGRLRDAGLSSIGAAAGAIGRGPIIITDVYRRSSSPLTSELNGVLGADRDGFVLIKAGTTGYIYITQMPDEIHGLQELAGLSRDSIGALADTARRRAATGLSEDKLAEILTRGDAEEIRRAFADMTPEMQRVAEAFLKDAEAR
jgi:hypothetical protein